MAAIPLDLLDRIRALERQLRELTGRTQIRPAMSEITHGLVKIAEGGSLEVWAPNGIGLVRVGAIVPDAEHPGNAEQQGVVMNRQDGSTAFSIFGARSEETGAAGPQSISLWDRSGNQVLSDETTTGWGVGTPYLPLPLYPVGIDPIVTESTFINRWFGTFPAQQPVASILLDIGAGGGSTAEVTVQYRTADEPSFTDVATMSVTAPASTARWESRWITFPLHGADWLLDVFVRVRVRQTSGSNGVTVNYSGGHTHEARSPQEIPRPRPTRTATRRSSTPATSGPAQGTNNPAARPPAAAPAFDAPAATTPPEPPIGLHTIDD
ncbi:hypothetical protein ACIQWR_32510 [Streptomyces sp. NPDC098789]|uniref:hypothetical protein n=1 Tax=Streptomyces sp. NPDC098789 TaxID=3366098 RepID=UPI00382433D4